MSAWNFTVAEAGIVDQVKAAAQQATGGWARVVGTRRDMASVAEEQQVSPSVWVVYDGFAVQSADEYTCTLLHRFLVVLAIKNAAAQREAAPLDDDAGAKLKTLFEALHGFVPPGCKTGLVPTTPPRPYPSPTFGYYPLAFTSESDHSVPPRY